MRELKNRQRCLQCKYYSRNSCPLMAEADVFKINKCILEYDVIKSLTENSLDHFVFYNNPKSPDGAVESSGDDLTGGNSDGGDDETLTVNLPKVNPAVQEIVFTATIHKATERRQNFGQVRNSYIRIYNAVTNEEIAKYDLDEDFSVETAVEFGRLYRRNGEWKFEAMGLGTRDGLQGLVNKYA